MTLLGTTKTKQDMVNIILDLANKRKQIVHGQQSVNAQVPKHLTRKTKDYDIYTKNPEQSAKELVKRLNKEYGNGFKVVQGVHKGTWKVKNKSGKTIADYTQSYKKPKSNTILGVRYTDLEYSKRKLRGILKEEAKSFRWDKDRDTLERIKQGEKDIW